ncbi:MAG TPA: SDR family oxidoreductase [Candidatus Saccharimonadales bacterium]|nr:SDR family oxidoreductase [Candidatus Saccharimonadales bacterium]
MRVLIVGCGYVGRALGVKLSAQGHQVFGMSRNATAAPGLISDAIVPVTADITKPESLAGLPRDYDWVVNAVSSGKGNVADYNSAYLEGTRNLIRSLAGSSIQKYICVSSTSVYGQTDGSAVKESSPTEPGNETSQILLQNEALLLESARKKTLPAIIIRSAGIYGPERGHLFLQYLADKARISGKGERLINMIHRDDLVGLIIAACRDGRPGEVYNGVDDEPVAQIHFFRWLSETLGKNMPPFATEEENTQKKRGLTQKKVSNRKAKMELGYQFIYPTFRQGYTAEIQRLDRAGLLNIEVEPR